MLDIGFGEILVLAAAALFIFGPDKLPKLAGDVARTFRTLRQMVTNARRDLTDSLGPEFDGINLEDLNPRTFVRKQLLDDIDADLDDTPAQENGRSSTSGRVAGSTGRVAGSSSGNGAAADRSNGGRRSNGGKHTPRHAAPLRQGERPPYDADAT